MHPSLECSLIWKNWSSLSPGFCGHGWNSINPGPASWLKVGISFFFFFFSELAVEEQLPLLLPSLFNWKGWGLCL